jgi:putative ABC transport system permease protein
VPRATLRSLLARKLRLMLSGLAIVLGVSFVSGTLVLTDSLGRVFDNLFATINAETAVTVRATSALGDDAMMDDREPVSAELLDTIREVDGVAEAVGWTEGYAQVVGPDGEAVTTGGAPTFGVTFRPDSQQESLVLREGEAPARPDEVVLDVATAERVGIEVGDRVTVLLRGPAEEFTVSGLVGFATTDNLAGAALTGFRPEVAQRVLGSPGTFSEIAVAAEEGVESDELQSRLAPVLPDGVEAVTDDEVIAEGADAVKEGLGFFSTALLVFAAISLFVGAFLIFNTFSMLVAQRTKELALLRALGASRRQVTGSVLLESVVVGLLASIVGFALGLAVAIGLRGLLGVMGIDLPDGETVVRLRTLVAALVIGVGVTAAAALIPARRAARISPVEAMRESGPAEDRSLARRGIGGGVLLVAGVALLAAGLTQGELPLVGLGAVLSFLGVATLSPFVARPVTGLLGAPFARLGVPGRLGRGNAVRSPRRTSATAAALMIGLALVSAVSVLGASIKTSVVAVVERSLGADYVLHTATYSPFSNEVATALREQPGVDAVAAFRFGEARVGEEVTSLQGVEPDALQSVLKLDTVAGDLDALDDGQLAMSEDAASGRGLSVGDEVPVTWSATGEQSMTLGAIYTENEFAGAVLVSGEVFDANTTQQSLGVVAVSIEDGASPAETRTAVDEAVAAFPNVVVEDQAEFIDAQEKQLDQLLNAITVLLVLSVLIAVLGIINTLALSVVERTRELGLLRAVGLSRRQLRRMIRVESVIISIYGALLGLGVGIAFGWALVRALREQGITEFTLPVDRLVLVLVAAGVAGVLAAALPARRAARLDVLQAVAST